MDSADGVLWVGGFCLGWPMGSFGRTGRRWRVRWGTLPPGPALWVLVPAAPSSQDHGSITWPLRVALHPGSSYFFSPLGLEVRQSPMPGALFLQASTLPILCK